MTVAVTCFTASHQKICAGYCLFRFVSQLCTLQEQREGTNLPIEYCPSLLNGGQCDYNTIRRQCHAVMWAVLPRRPYPERIPLTIRTGRDCLKPIVNLSGTTSILERGRVRLSERRFDIVYGPHIKNQSGDGLSRFKTRGEDNTDIKDDNSVATVYYNGDKARQAKPHLVQYVTCVTTRTASSGHL